MTELKTAADREWGWSCALFSLLSLLLDFLWKGREAHEKNGFGMRSQILKIVHWGNSQKLFAR